MSSFANKKLLFAMLSSFEECDHEYPFEEIIYDPCPIEL